MLHLFVFVPCTLKTQLDTMLFFANLIKSNIGEATQELSH